MLTPIVKWSAIGLGSLAVVFVGTQAVLHSKGSLPGGGKDYYAQERAAREAAAEKYAVKSTPVEPSPTASPVVANSITPSQTKTNPTVPVTTAVPKTAEVQVADTKTTSAPVEKNCPSIDNYIATMERDNPPSWSQLDCYFAKLSRKNIPSFYSRVSIDYDNPAILGNSATNYYNAWSSYNKQFGTNLSTASTIGVPPYVGADRKVFTYPLSSANFDLKMRGSATVFAKEKLNGNRVIFQTFHPPSQIAPAFTSVDQFRAWLADTWVPQKKVEAEVAEKIKAEYYVPFPVEADIFFNKVSQPTLGNLPGDQLVPVVQDWINQTRDAVRPIYKGRLVIQLAAKVSDGPHWKNLSIKGFDEMAGTLLPTCDAASAKTEAESQYKHYADLSKLDGIAWSMGELGLFEKYFKACDHSLASMELSVLDAVLPVAISQDPKPVGLNVDNTYTSDAARQKVIDFFRANGG